jgi:hypothetical protein
MTDVEEEGKSDGKWCFFRNVQTTLEEHGEVSRFFERFVDEHDRDIANDGIDAVTLHALQPFFDDELLAAHFVAELVAHDDAPRLRKWHRPHLFLAYRAGKNLEQLGLDRHGGAECNIAVSRLRGRASSTPNLENGATSKTT